MANRVHVADPSIVGQGVDPHDEMHVVIFYNYYIYVYGKGLYFITIINGFLYDCIEALFSSIFGHRSLAGWKLGS